LNFIEAVYITASVFENEVENYTMHLVLKIYTDKNLKDIKRVVEVDRLKIPYRVGIYLLELLENENINNDVDLIKLMVTAPDKLDRIVKCTFELTDSELECVKLLELGTELIKIYKWIIETVKVLKGINSKKSVNGSENRETLTLLQMIFDINKDLCSTYPALEPLKLLDYPAEDVFNLIAGTMDYANRQELRMLHSGYKYSSERQVCI